MTIKNNDEGQALVGGLIALLLVLLFSAYFLFTAESYLRLFSNAEYANKEALQNGTDIANALNEIAFNNQNIVVSISIAQNALLKSLEYGLYIGFHQPYWKTHKFSQNNVTSFLSPDSKSSINQIFLSSALTSARGFFMAKSLSERNKEILNTLPLQLRKFFIQSSDSFVNCMAIESQKEFYKSPGILNLPTLKLYPFYFSRTGKNACTIEHRRSSISQFLQFALPVLFSQEKDFILDYSSLDSLFLGDNSYRYGVTLVNPIRNQEFIYNLNFKAKNSIKEQDDCFSMFAKYLSKITYFKNLKLDQKTKLLSAPFINYFSLTHKLIRAPNWKKEKINDNYEIFDDRISDNKFLRAFFYPNWTVTGIYEL